VETEETNLEIAAVQGAVHDKARVTRAAVLNRFCVQKHVIEQHQLNLGQVNP
jgi:hypothetical protein